MASANEQPVEGQLAAYNAGDVEAFVDWYAEDVEVFELPGGERTLSGRAEMRERYARLFARYPAQRCRILSRVVHGPFVVDHEEVTGRDAGAPVYAVAIYHVEDGRIRRVWFLEAERR